MLDARITDIARRMTQIQFEERSEQLQRDIARVQSEAGSRGMGRSGAVISSVHDLCARDVELRAIIIWHNLLRVLNSSDVRFSEELGNELKQEFQHYENEIYADASDRLQTVIRNTGVGFQPTLAASRIRALAKITAEIDLFVLALAQTERARTENPSAPAIHFHSTVGTVQTGPNATATVIQSFHAEDREILLEALQLVKSGLEALETLPSVPKEEIIDLIVNARTEIDKPRPNGTLLRSSLTAIAMAIQTVGSLQPAYDALKTALLLFGVQLP